MRPSVGIRADYPFASRTDILHLFDIYCHLIHYLLEPPIITVSHNKNQECSFNKYSREI